MYADDRKLIGVIEKEEDAIEIQKDIDSMQNWAKTWQMFRARGTTACD